MATCTVTKPKENEVSYSMEVRSQSNQAFGSVGVRSKVPNDMHMICIYLFSHGCEVMPVRGYGFCFLNAIDLLLCCDYNEVVTVSNLASNILGHLVANVDYYKQFHTEDILQDTEGYFKFGNYCDSIIGQVLTATAKALKMNESANISERARWK